MNRILMLLSLFLVPLSDMQAKLIDETPGGFNPANGLPPAFFQLQKLLFFDEAAFGTFDLPGGPTFINGWVSQFGVLNGGQFFFTNLFQVSPTASALISWNFAGQSDGDWLTAVDVFGRTPSGTAVENIYRVPWQDRFASPGDQTVTLDGSTQIMGISFYGLNPATVPDSASSLALLAAGLFALGVISLCSRLQRLRL